MNAESFVPKPKLYTFQLLNLVVMEQFGPKTVLIYKFLGLFQLKEDSVVFS